MNRQTRMIRLGDIAHGRSGDKGNHANIGVIAYTAAGHAFLERELTAEKVKDYFRTLSPDKVERFDLAAPVRAQFRAVERVGGRRVRFPAHRYPRQGLGHGPAGDGDARIPDNLAAMLPSPPASVGR